MGAPCCSNVNMKQQLTHQLFIKKTRNWSARTFFPAKGLQSQLTQLILSIRNSGRQRDRHRMTHKA